MAFMSVWVEMIWRVIGGYMGECCFMQQVCVCAYNDNFYNSLCINHMQPKAVCVFVYS